MQGQAARIEQAKEAFTPGWIGSFLCRGAPLRHAGNGHVQRQAALVEQADEVVVPAHDAGDHVVLRQVAHSAQPRVRLGLRTAARVIQSSTMCEFRLRTAACAPGLPHALGRAVRAAHGAESGRAQHTPVCAWASARLYALGAAGAAAGALHSAGAAACTAQGPLLLRLALTLSAAPLAATSEHRMSVPGSDGCSCTPCMPAQVRPFRSHLEDPLGDLGPGGGAQLALGQAHLIWRRNCTWL